MKKALAVLILGLILVVPVRAAVDIDGDSGLNWLRDYGTHRKSVRLF